MVDIENVKERNTFKNVMKLEMYTSQKLILIWILYSPSMSNPHYLAGRTLYGPFSAVVELAGYTSKQLFKM